MGTIKISILEQDGVDLDVATEMDLLAALNYIGFTGGGNTATADIDFGLNENCFASTTVSASWISSTSSLSMTILPNTLDHDSEDALLEEIKVTYGNIVDGVSFDIFAHAPNDTWGRYKVKIIGV